MRSIFGIIMSLVIGQCASGQLFVDGASGSLSGSTSASDDGFSPCSRSSAATWGEWNVPTLLDLACYSRRATGMSQSQLLFSRIGTSGLQVTCDASAAGFGPGGSAAATALSKGSVSFITSPGTTWTLHGTLRGRAAGVWRVSVLYRGETVYTQSYGGFIVSQPVGSPPLFTSGANEAGVWQIVVSSDSYAYMHWDSASLISLVVQTSGPVLSRQWALADDSSLGAKWQHAMAWQGAANRVVSFGGRDAAGTFVDDTLTWDGATWTELNSAVAPSARADHAMCELPGLQANNVVMFGGQTQSGQLLGDTWTLQGDTWTPHTLSPRPTPRGGHTLSYDSTRDRAVLFGGFISTPQGFTYTSQTWEIAPVTFQPSWQLRTPTVSPSGRFAHASAYDPLRQRTVVFGGWNATGLLGDTWEWDGTTWTQRTGDMPPARYYHAMYFDATLGGVVLVGGSRGTYPPEYFSDRWLLTQAGWQRIADLEGGARWAFAAAVSRNSGQVVIAGGATTRADTWTTTFAPTFVTQPVNQVVSVGDTISLAAAAAGSEVTYQWFRDGEQLIDNARVSGSTSPALTILQAQTSDIGSYTCVATNVAGSVTSMVASVDVVQCDSIDFNNNGVFPEDQDVVDFFSVLAGGTCAACNDIDFNNNGVFPEDQDVIDFFNVLAGGACP